MKLPDDKILIPGVVSHCVYQVEHPELVAERIERVIAGTDCGLATSRIATSRLWPQDLVPPPRSAAGHWGKSRGYIL